MSKAERNPESPGWGAIDDVVDALYPGQEPVHVGTIVRWRMGGRDPLDGISAYRSEAGGIPHWHMVSYGMSELYAKESDIPEQSGWGFEFTFRVARAAADEKQPGWWAFNFLQGLGRYVFETGNSFSAGHHMDLNGPIQRDGDTAIRAVLFARDPELPEEIQTPNGFVRFIQVVGVTLDELDAVRMWDTEGFLDVMRARNPLWVTDLGRASLLEDAAFAAEVNRRTNAEGSSLGASRVDELAWTAKGAVAEVRLGALVARQLGRMVLGRVGHGRPYWLLGQESQVNFEPGDRDGWSAEGEQLRITLTRDGARRWAEVLRARQGVYEMGGGVVVHVSVTRVKDDDGNVTEVIGE